MTTIQWWYPKIQDTYKNIAQYNIRISSCPVMSFTAISPCIVFIYYVSTVSFNLEHSPSVHELDT